MPTLTLTAKRQATFPVETCRTLGLKPGDVVELELRQESDGPVWILRPRPERSRRWVGCLASYGQAASTHDLVAVRRSVAAGRGKAADA